MTKRKQPHGNRSKSFAARWPGGCHLCDVPIAVGDEICYHHDRICHRICAEEEDS